MAAVSVLPTHRRFPARAGPLRILIADDHRMVLEALNRFLSSCGFQVVAMAENGRRAVALARQTRAEVAILDATMPVMGGIEAARKIRRADRRVRILLLTEYGDEGLVSAALNSGVSGVMVKAQGLEDLMLALRQVSTGAIYLSPCYSPAILAALADRPLGGDHALTRREVEVLRLIADGKSMKQVAGVLTMSIRTAEWHRASIMDKLKVRDTASLVRYAIRFGLIVA